MSKVFAEYMDKFAQRLDQLDEQFVKLSNKVTQDHAEDIMNFSVDLKHIDYRLTQLTDQVDRSELSEVDKLPQELIKLYERVEAIEADTREQVSQAKDLQAKLASENLEHSNMIIKLEEKVAARADGTTNEVMQVARWVVA